MNKFFTDVNPLLDMIVICMIDGDIISNNLDAAIWITTLESFQLINYYLNCCINRLSIVDKNNNSFLFEFFYLDFIKCSKRESRRRFRQNPKNK